MDSVGWKRYVFVLGLVFIWLIIKGLPSNVLIYNIFRISIWQGVIFIRENFKVTVKKDDGNVVSFFIFINIRQKDTLI